MVPVPNRQEERLPALRQRLRARYPLLQLVAADERDALRLLETAAAEVGLPLRVVHYGASEPMPTALAGLAALVQATQPSLLVLPDGHRLLRQPGLARAVVEALTDLERVGHVVVFLTPVPVACLELHRDLVTLTVPLPGQMELEPLARAALSDGQGRVAPALLQASVQALRGMTQAQARRALRRVRQEGLQAQAAAVLQDEKRDLVASGGLLEIIEAVPHLDAVGGLDDLKAWLLRRRKALEPEARAFGLPPPRGVLVVGVQGCGKSLVCKASAAALGVPLVRLDLGRLHTSATVPDENLRHALAVAEAMAPCVLWLDEIDKAFAHALTGASEAGARLLGSLLTWLGEQQAGVFVAATANRVDHLPAELLRKGRFDETFFVDLPDATVRAEILALHLKKSGRDPAAFAIETLAKAADRLTGAEIEQAIVEALAHAYAEARPLAEADVQAALSKTVPLVETYEPQVKALREWARRRCRPAARDRSLRDLYAAALVPASPGAGTGAGAGS